MALPAQVNVAILGAVSQEVDPLCGLLRGTREVPFRGSTLRVGTVNGRPVLVGVTGLGKVNAAITVAALLEHCNISEVWNVGCAGAYRESTLDVGDVLVTDNSIFGDEGILAGWEVLSPKEIGIPLLINDGEALYDAIPLNSSSAFRRVREKTPEGWYRLDESCIPSPAGESDRGAESFRLAFGPSLTVGMVSGDVSTAEKRFLRYGALAENMEGSAVAQACFRFNVPVLECRGISNIAGDRCKARWDMAKAMAHCHGIVARWMERGW